MGNTTQRHLCSLSKEQAGALSNNDCRSSPELDCLTCCLRLIGRSSLPLHFIANRKKFHKLLSDVLDRSTNIRLLLAASIQIGRLVLKDHRGGPLTRQESNHFVRRRSSPKNHEEKTTTCGNDQLESRHQWK